MGCRGVVSYVVLIISRKIAARRMRQGNNPNVLKQNETLQRKISVIIVTDFLCWVPFIIISAFHNFKVIDATTWYANFTMLVLPLNSVINPLIYEDSIREFLWNKIQFIKGLRFIHTLTNLVQFCYQARNSEQDEIHELQIVPLDES